MNINILCVGKVKEKFFRDAIDEYSKRLSKFAKISIIEVSDEKTKDGASEVENKMVIDKEGSKLLSYIKSSDYVISLCIEGKKLSSEKLADKISDICLSGNSTITFVIGGSLGLSDEIKNRSDFKLSFSDMTFPHQLMRVILLEQIYRAFKINNNEPYHK
ncbi:MAG: 23S rRNA (pseudouridine(1915)-N(3))-methyltransferase RlmH [Lachnospiraceae bacterium]|nr:23S rRNA (pseudouridine(1915)-N(3))-methyltransferase RlmH [Lachnospiraceae bacterium]